MPVALPLIDHRLAFLALAAMIVGAAVPLAFAWARIIPEEAPPFNASAPSRASTPAELNAGASAPRHGAAAIALLVLVTLSYAIQFPGVPRQVGLHWLESFGLGIEPAWISWGLESLFVFLNAGVACYALFGPKNSLRLPLGVGATLVLILWIFAHFLRQSLLGNPS